MADELLDTIKENAQAPAEAHDDAGGMKQHSLFDRGRSLSVRADTKGSRLNR